MSELLEVFRFLVSVLLPLVPVEHLSGILTEEARKRAERIADAAERAKFPGEGP